jgi:hypothetical protein
MVLFGRGTWLYSVGLLKCPRCSKGDLFPTKTFSFRKSFDMHDNCPHCKQKFALEPGFWFGSMFISYILSAFMLFAIFGFFKFLVGLEVLPSFILMTTIAAILYVWFFRVSRAIWLTFFLKYDKQAAK